MKVNMTVPLCTREVYQLFERKIKGNRLFMEAILHKINKVLWQCRLENPEALMASHEFEQQLKGLIKQFSEEISGFEELLTRKQPFIDKKIDYSTQFRPCILVDNRLSLLLIDYLEMYDRLIATLQLLNIGGFFETKAIYFSNLKRYQKRSNQALSRWLLM